MRIISRITYVGLWLAFIALVGKGFASGGVQTPGEVLAMQGVFVFNWGLNGLLMPLYVMFNRGPMRAQYRFWLGAKIIVLGALCLWASLTYEIAPTEGGAWFAAFGGMCGILANVLYWVDFLPGWGKADRMEEHFYMREAQWEGVKAQRANEQSGMNVDGEIYLVDNKESRKYWKEQAANGPSRKGW